VVLDIFSGAGTTGLVALKAGRHYVGIDLKAEYLDMTIARLEPILAQGVLL
jgi:DNA modification methylase